MKQWSSAVALMWSISMLKDLRVVWAGKMLKADSPDIHFGLGVVREGSQQSVVFWCSALACQCWKEAGSGNCCLHVLFCTTSWWLSAVLEVEITSPFNFIESVWIAGTFDLWMSESYTSSTGKLMYEWQWKYDSKDPVSRLPVCSMVSDKLLGHLWAIRESCCSCECLCVSP